MDEDTRDGGVSEDARDRGLSRRSILRSAGGAAAGAVAMAGTASAGSETTNGTDGGDDPAYPSAAWFRREQRNYALTREAPNEQQNPAFQRRWQAQSARNAAAFRRRTATEPGWNSEGNLCKEYAEQCTGDPYLYPAGGADGYGGHPVYDAAVRRRVAFYDRQGARLSGHLWAPADASPGDDLPGVVITNGSVQAPETTYWWFAATLVRNGYVVMTYDPRGQGRSDTTTPDGTPGTNLEPSVFVTNQVDAIDFFRSTPADCYDPNQDHLNEAAPVESYNPYYRVLDRSRLGIAGHSAGAIGASVVQGLDPWPTGGPNPVDAGLAWDNLGTAEETDPYQSGGLTARFADEIAPGRDATPRVPMMGQSGDYFLSPAPKRSPPDPDRKARGFGRWREAGVPSYQLVIRGGTHYEWSRVPSFPARSWEVGNALADHYSLAWLDRWLKRPGEDGYRTADDRLLADDRWRDQLSFYYRSKRAFPTRAGDERTCEDIRTGCTEEPGQAPTGGGQDGSAGTDGGSTENGSSGLSLV